MANRIANHVKGKIQYYAELARDGAPEINCLLLLSAGLQGDDALQDHTTIAGLLAASNDEPTFTNYARRQLPAPVVTIDNVANRVILTIAGAAPRQISWPNAGAAQAIGKIVFYYDPAPGSATPDSGLIYLCSSDVGAVTDGTTLVVTLTEEEGFAYLANPA